MFHFKTSLQEWKHLQSCWKIIANELKNGDPNLNNCIFILNSKLFDNHNNNKESQTSKNIQTENNNNNDDISIETMIDLIDEIENDTQNNDTSLSSYPPSVIKFISKPVKFLYIII